MTPEQFVDEIGSWLATESCTVSAAFIDVLGLVDSA
jgi:hypothetical protein